MLATKKHGRRGKSYVQPSRNSVRNPRPDSSDGVPIDAATIRQSLIHLRIRLMFVAIAAALFTATLSFAMTPQSSSVPDARRPRPVKFSKPAVIEFKGEIDQQLTLYFNNRFDRAERSGVDLLIIEIDSPGGLKIESLQMARKIRDCKWAYTVAVITNEAISGGALVSLGVDEIFIDPNAKFGDVGEIGFDPEAFAWRLIEPKIESYLSRDARDLAESKGRSPDLAEAMVDKDVLVYAKPKALGNAPDGKNEADNNMDGEAAAAANGGQNEVNEKSSRWDFKLVRASEEVQPKDPWVLVPETGRERFLTLSGQRTKELGIAQHFASSREDAMKQVGVSKDDVRIFKRTTTDAVVYYLNTTFITALLVIIGLISLYLELTSPGIGVGGLMAGLCAVLFFWSRFLGGTSGWLEVILFAAGLTFVAMEIFVIPGFGVSGFAGIALLFVSVMLASQDYAMPTSATQWNQTLSTALMILCSGCVFLIAAAFISKRLGSIPIFNRLILAPDAVADDESTPKDEFGKPIPQSHPIVSVGDWGVSESLLRPAGRAKFSGRSFDVISDGSFVEPDTQVKVIRISGNVITVAVIEETDDETTYQAKES